MGEKVIFPGTMCYFLGKNPGITTPLYYLVPYIPELAVFKACCAWYQAIIQNGQLAEGICLSHCNHKNETYHVVRAAI